VDERNRTIAFGPVGFGGLAVLLLGILTRRRLLSVIGLAGVLADLTAPGLGGFGATESRSAADEDAGA
jgi:hypothetical protein